MGAWLVSFEEGGATVTIDIGQAELVIPTNSDF